MYNPNSSNYLLCLTSIFNDTFLDLIYAGLFNKKRVGTIYQSKQNY
jgi:hypothetical protein